MALFRLALFAALSANVLTQNPLPPAPSCNATYFYRSYDGTCNNLNNPQYGQSETIFQRLMGPANYADGVSKIRLSVTGSPLPSTRLVSTVVTLNESVSDSSASFITMQWGQFLDHDLTQSQGSVSSTGGSISCCDGGRFGNNTANPNPQCLAIPIPGDDPIYSNVNCMNFVRSAFGLHLNGSTPTNRQQINVLTHWIDGSQIYGNKATTALSLRDTSTGKGLLKISTYSGRTMLPLTNTCCPGDPTNSCSEANACFVAGDSRVREQPLLTVMHTLWLREHNRVANALFNLYGTSKSDEFYYQEARRIVIAELQDIIYNEYLPVLLDPVGMGIVNSPSDSSANPAVFNEFAAAAFRIGHSQLRSFIRLYEADGSESLQSYFLGNSFNLASRILAQNFTDNAIRGLLRNFAQNVDECFADDVTSQLFRSAGAPLGGDLISINMQRGRDHGLPPYIIAREIATGEPRATSFADLSSTHSPYVIDSLKSVYASVEDIDLYIGGVTETHQPGALVGPTFDYIIAKQFQNLKNSDRFFYSDTTQSVSFTSKQVAEIKKTSLARIICDNNDGTVTKIQPSAFLSALSNRNAPVPCSQIPSIDLSKLTSVAVKNKGKEDQNEDDKKEDKKK